MSNRAHRRARRPAYLPDLGMVDWKVVAIVDDDHCQNPGCVHHRHDRPAPDGAAAMFAYTVGLHQRHQLPELYLDADPTDTATFGPCQMSPQLLCETLNDLGSRLVEGKAGPGGYIDVGGTVRGARCVYTFTFGQTCPRDSFQAYQAHPRAFVIPITWTVRPA
jgi:hypothetical protein